MNPKQTWILVLIAIVLFLIIYFAEGKRSEESPLVLPALKPSEVQTLEISYFTNSVSIFLARSNGGWFLQNPPYPAQSTPIDQLTGQLASLRAYDTLTAKEVFIQGLASFGLEPPLARLRLQAGTNLFDLQLGKRTPLTNHVYLKIGKEDSVFVTDAAFLENLPVERDSLRERSIIHLTKNLFDALQIRSGQRIVELQRNPTNSQWQITRPVPARADQIRVGLLLEHLERAQAAAFISDSPAGDLEKFGLQNPSVELRLLQGTNLAGQLSFGSAFTNQPGFVYARLPVYSNVVLTARALADSLNQPYKSFHDPRLIQFPLTNLGRIDIKSTESFALLRNSSNRWSFAEPITMPLDMELLARFFTNISALQILDIARELPTEADLKAFGFTNPLPAVSFFSAQTNGSGAATNVLLTQLQYGSNLVDSIFVRRTDEVPIYLGSLSDMLTLPRRAFELRDRQLWTWQGTNVLSVTLTGNGKSRVLQRAPTGDWNPDPVLNAAIEETIHRLTTARAASWVYKGTERLRSFGLAQPSLTITFKDRAGDQNQISFGTITMKKDVYATTILPGDTEPVVFEFSGFLYQDLLRNLPQPQ